MNLSIDIFAESQFRLGMYFAVIWEISEALFEENANKKRFLFIFIITL